MPHLLRSPILRLIALLLIAAGVRLIHFTKADLWQDEVNEVFIAEGSFEETLTRIRESEMRPPLRYYVLKVWLWGGRDTHYLRLPSLLFSVAAVGMLYLAARKRLSEEVAMTAAALMAAASFPVSSAQFCRSYSQDLFMATLAGHAFFCHEDRQTWLTRLYYVLAALLCIYTSYFIGLVLAVFLAAHLWAWRSGRMKWQELACLYSPVALLSLPLVPLMLEQMKNARANQWHAAGADIYQLLEYFTVLGAGRIKNWDFNSRQYFVALLCLFFAVLGGRALLREGSTASKPGRRPWVFVVWFAAPVMLIFLFSLKSIGLFTIRTMIVYAPAYYVMVAAGLMALTGPWVRLAVLGVLCVLNVREFSASGDLRYLTNGSSKAADFLQREAAQGEQVIHAEHFTYFPLRFYAPELQHRIFQKEVPWNWGRGQVPKEHLVQSLEKARKLPGFWFVRKRHFYSMFASEEDDYQHWLRQLVELSSPWLTGKEGEYGFFQAERSMLSGNVCLTHYISEIREGPTPDIQQRLKESLLRIQKDGIYVESSPYSGYVLRALEELR